MASIIKRGKYLHLQWYDPVTKKVMSKSTGLTATTVNLKKAKKFSKEFQWEISKQFRHRKNIGFREITIKEAYQHFLKINNSKHPKTIADYNYFYKYFINSFNEESYCSVITKFSIEDWLMEIKELSLKKNTIHAIGKQCNHFLNFLFEYSYVPVFKINRDVKTRPEQIEKIIFSDKDILNIHHNLKNKSENFQLLVLLAFYTGLRSSDLLNINSKRIDLKNQILRYYSPKRKKFREIPFHNALVEPISLSLRNNSSSTLLQYSSTGNIGKAIARYIKEIKIDGKGYSARTFRKTFITLCRSRFNMDASIVRELVGHEQGNTTDKYYNQISIDAMKAELKKFNFKGI